MNPITKQKYGKVSSQKIKEMWIEVQKIINENKQSKKSLNKVKVAYYLTNIAEYIQQPNEKVKNTPIQPKKFAKINIKPMKLDNNLETRYLVFKNPALKIVPNFVKLNAQKSTVIEDTAHTSRLSNGSSTNRPIYSHRKG